MVQTNPGGDAPAPGHDVLRSTIASSFASNSPLAERALAEDIAACSSDGEGSDEPIPATNGTGSSTAVSAVDDSTDADHEDHHPLYRRASGVAYGGTRPILNPQAPTEDTQALNPLERKQSRDAERDLLRDNHLLHSSSHQSSSQKKTSFVSKLYQRLFGTESTSTSAEPGHDEQLPTETSPLLAGAPADQDSDEDVEQQWEQALAAGQIRSSWQRESKTIAAYSGPLIVTFFLQYSVNVASIFAVGRIGTIELGAVSLANMSSAITCMAPFQGLATSLDTLCAQAYGSGHKHLVGLQFQRMVCFLFTLTIPVAVLWWFSEDILRQIVPDPQSAFLAGQYLRVMILSMPGLILFECGKRFVQAQGIFHATTYVLLIAAPFNIFILWLLVWKLDMGFIGAPISVAITDNFMPVLLFLYVRFIDGSQCWGGFSKRALTNWWVMIRLALPGMIMVEAEWLAFEIMTLMASRFGSDYLAAQSALTTLASISYQIPFPVSIAASTRIANLIGAGLVDAAKTAGRVTFIVTLIVGLFNVLIFSVFRYQLPLAFTTDPKVIELVANVLPIVAFMEIFDGLSAGAHGLLRGVGKQSIGGPANLFAYYVVSLPVSLGLAFGLDWRLHGMWVGVTLGLITTTVIEYTYLMFTNWENAAREAAARNAAG